MEYTNFKEDLLSGKIADLVREEVRDHVVSSCNEVYNVMKPIVAQHPDVEKFYGIFLTAKNTVISIEELFSGSITSCSVYPREIVKKALELGAAAVIACHNHPSGSTDISSSDEAITKVIFSALKTIKVELHDHVIIGNSTYASLRNNTNIFEEAAAFCADAGI